MIADIRINVSFFKHPKTVKLQRRLGAEAVLSLQQLWINKSDGALTDMDYEDIAIA
ncbi:hypothetical protein MBAV_000824, partial [Candidatus Magnetobacterium bavaricum]